MKVINIKTGEKFTHYIGRACYGYEESPLHNPFKIGTRKEKIENFKIYLENSDDLINYVKSLSEDAVLGCWCKPQGCHGDVIVELWNRMNPPSVKNRIKFR